MSRDFHRRFRVSVSSEEAERRFVERALLYVFRSEPVCGATYYSSREYEVLVAVAVQLGERLYPHTEFRDLIKGDFHRCLEALEALYWTVREHHREQVEGLIDSLIENSEVDLAVRWRDGAFWPAGARQLDEELVNENLDWLASPDWITVLQPYEKGLKDLLQAHRQPARLADVITDMYEALEAAAKIVTGRDKDLSKNRDGLLRRLNAVELKGILAAYIEYANAYRHASKPGQPRKQQPGADVETFVYLTGVFLRRVKRWHQDKAQMGEEPSGP